MVNKLKNPNFEPLSSIGPYWLGLKPVHPKKVLVASVGHGISCLFKYGTLTSWVERGYMKHGAK
jgi:hypothetical protein